MIADQLDNKENEYKKYIKNHIANVKTIWKQIQKYLINEYWLDDYNCGIIDNLIKRHDKSKYEQHEFNGYRQYFYPTDRENKNKTQFKYAWNYHQKANPHHWQYWLMWSPEGTKPLEIPFEYIFEMLCDWTSMSLNFGNDVWNWYEKERKNMLFASNSGTCVERWLPLFDNVLQDIGGSNENNTGK